MTLPSPTAERSSAQVRLSDKQIEAFYHDQFVRDQVADFSALVGSPKFADGVVVDVGGGCGFFAKALIASTASQVRVIDSDPLSVDACRKLGVEASCEDALNPKFVGDEGAICFNLILHHLVTSSESATAELQQRALALWSGRARLVFVNEYIYESYVPGLSGWLIFQITKSRLLSALGSAVSRFVTAFRANTFGIGVRFRSHSEWRALFARAGYEVAGTRVGHSERVSPALRFLLIREIRRDSFVLVPRGPSA